MRQILEATQVDGDPFSVDGADYFIVLAGHAGGTWHLQLRDPGDATAWRDLSDQEWIDNEIHDFRGGAGLQYRMHGGSVGARAYLAPSGVVDIVETFRLPGVVRALALTTPEAGEIYVVWEAPSNPGSGDLERYHVRVTPTGADAYEVEPTAVASITIAGLTAGIVHTIEVRAETRIGRGEWVSEDATPN